VWLKARTSRSPPAFEAEYGEDGSIGDASVKVPSSIDPYTSSVEICTCRTSASRAASSSTKVPKTSVVMNSPGDSIERSTCDSAAKFTSASQPSSAERTASRSAMSASTSSKRSSGRPSRFSRRPA
jgi:hypothetical protein